MQGGARIRNLRWMAVLVLLCLVAVACGAEGDVPGTEPAAPPAAEQEEPDEPDPTEPDAEEAPQDAAALFEGETIRVVLGFQPGSGVYETAQLIGSQLSQRLPGSPNYTVEILEGAGGARATHHVVSTGQDGLGIVVQTFGVLARHLSGLEGHDYPLQDMHIIAALPDGVVTLINSNYADGPEALLAADGPLNMSDSAPGGAVHWAQALLSELFDLDINFVFGYQGGAPQMLALESGEVMGNSHGKRSYHSWGRLIDEGVAWPWVETGVLDEGGEVSRSAGPPEEVPTILERYIDTFGEPPPPELLADVEYMAGLGSLTFHAAMAPDADPDRLQLIQQALREMVEDPATAEASLEFFDSEPVLSGPDEAQLAMDSIFANLAALERILERIAQDM